MTSKTKRSFSIALIGVMLLSLFLVLVPAMAEDTTDAKALYETTMYDDQEHLKSKVTGLETESFSTTLDGIS